MPRFRTAAAAAILAVPIVAGGFLLQRPPQRSGATLLNQVMSLVSTQYVDTLPSTAIYEKAASGLVKDLDDPYSELLSPQASEEFDRQTNGRYGGTGMLIGEDTPGTVVVERVFPNTPADDAGVREGDHIVSVDKHATGPLSLDKVSNLLRGEPGSKVSVTYTHPGVTDPITLQFTRRVVHVPAVAYTAVFGDHIGYIPLQTFNENTAEEVDAAIASLKRQGAKGLVLDMRDNGGGIVEQALETSSLFLHEGQEIVSVRSRNEAAEVERASGKHLALDIPLVVLVNDGSASATEIVAGALQDHDRALVVGSNTFGKGLVQSLYQLDGGYHLKITTGKWYTPSGRSIHRPRKLLPNGDFVVVRPDSTNGDTAARPAYRSDAGRIVYGGGGIHPDVVVPNDTLPTDQRAFLRAIAAQGQAVNAVLQDYALELQHHVDRGFTPPAAWTTELMRRLALAKITIDPKYDSAARVFLTRDLASRVARLAFGDAAAKEQQLSLDRQLETAIALLEHSTTQAQLLASAATSAPGSSKR